MGNHLPALLRNHRRHSFCWTHWCQRWHPTWTLPSNQYGLLRSLLHHHNILLRICHLPFAWAHTWTGNKDLRNYETHVNDKIDLHTKLLPHLGLFHICHCLYLVYWIFTCKRKRLQDKFAQLWSRIRCDVVCTFSNKHDHGCKHFLHWQ